MVYRTAATSSFQVQPIPNVMAVCACQQTHFMCLIVVFSFISSTKAIYYRRFQSISDCLTGPSDAKHEFYDISQLLCKECTQTTRHQTVSSDGKGPKTHSFAN